jgi:predicted enzyme related to lactoylglutathione lyase
MPKATVYPPGTPCWVDLGTADVDAAARFYSGLFGWEIGEGPPEAGGYRMCMYHGEPVAGLGPQMGEAERPYWNTYVATDDADKTTALVAEAGGTTLVPPMDVLTAGRMAVFADTVGAVFSIWQAREHIGAGLVNEPNTLSWNELTCRDGEAAKAFYGAVFGVGFQTEDMGHGQYTMFTVADRVVGGLMVMDENWPAEIPSHWMPYFAVEDTDASVVRATELGGAVMVPPTDIPPGRFAVLNDPQGAVFTVIKLLMADAPPS